MTSSNMNGKRHQPFRQQTLFAIPQPVTRHSHFLPHGRRASRRSSSADSRFRGSNLGSDSDEDDDGISTVAVSTTDFETEDEEEQQRVSSKKFTRNRRFNLISTFREKHLQNIYDLLLLSIQREDSKRSFKCLRILLYSNEWDPIELWRFSLQILTMISSDHEVRLRRDDGGSESQFIQEEQAIAKKRLAFMRQLNKSRASALQVDLLLEMIPEMMMLGLEEQAMEEIDVVLNTYPFRLEPLLHLYSAMLYLIVCERSVKSSSRTSGLINDIERIKINFIQASSSSSSEFSKIDKELAFIPKTLFFLKQQNKDENSQFQLQKIEQKFEMVLTVGLAISKRGRRDVRSQSQSRSVSVSRSRSQSRSTTGTGNRNRSDVSNSESEAHSEPIPTNRQRRKRRRGRGRSDFEDGDDDGEDTDHSAPVLRANVERDDIRVMNDGWARAMARAYLAMLRSPFTIQQHYGEVNDEL